MKQRLKRHQRKHYYSNSIMANKIDRTNLKRKAQRLESYSTLVTKRRVAIFNNDNNTLKKSSSETIIPGKIERVVGCKENKDVKNNIHGSTVVLLSRSSTDTGSGSSSSDESLEYMSAYQSLHKSMIKSNLAEFEATSVMTRSASRKYVTVGALHNKVNIEEELKRTVHWPENISYPILRPTNEDELLKNTVSEAFFQVMAFCKLAKDSTFFSKRCSQETVFIPNETLTSLDLSTYSTHERMIVIDEDNVIPLCKLEQGVSAEGQDNGAYQPINLYPEPSFMLETLEGKTFTQKSNLYLPCNTAILVNSSPDDLAIAVHNDHSYALRYNENDKLNERSPSNDPLSDFKLDDALNSLMLNTALLKCLVCGEFPQDIASYLKKF